MAPKRADKGKRPMSELEAETPRRSTRSRGLGIHIAEPPESPRQVVAEAVEEVPVEPEQMAREMPSAEQLAPEMPEASGAAHSVDEPQIPAPGMAAPAVGAVGVEPDVDPGVTPQQMAAMMQLMAGAVQGMRQDMIGVSQAIQQLAQAQSQQRTPSDPIPSSEPAVRVQAPVREHVAEAEVEIIDLRQRRQEERSDMKAFQEMRPPTFMGEMDYRVADRWVARMEKIFSYLRCTDEQKVRYATFMLDGDAEQWWRFEQRVLPNGGRDLTWTRFLDIFYHHYVPASEQTRRAAEFISLSQGRLSVAEYDAQFKALCRFVRWTQMDPREEARKFQEGLKPSIRGKLAAFGLEDYGEILDKARRIEREEEQWAKVQERRRGPEQRRGGRFQGRGQRPRRVEQIQPTPCPTCGRNHTGPCMAGSGVCFGCGQQGHRRPDCPYRDSTCPVCGKVGHTRETCFRAREQRTAPQRVHQHLHGVTEANRHSLGSSISHGWSIDSRHQQ